MAVQNQYSNLNESPSWYIKMVPSAAKPSEESRSNSETQVNVFLTSKNILSSAIKFKTTFQCVSILAAYLVESLPNY